MGGICGPANSPCCFGMTLRSGAKFLAVVLLLKDMFGFAYFANSVSGDLKKAWNQNEHFEDIILLDDDDDDEDTALLTCILFYGAAFLFTMLDSVMAVILYMGASQGRSSNCRTWVWYGAIVLICCAAVLSNTMLTDMNAAMLWIGGSIFALYGYTLLVAKSLKDDLILGDEHAAMIQQFAYVDMNNNNMSTSVPPESRCPLLVSPGSVPYQRV